MAWVEVYGGHAFGHRRVETTSIKKKNKMKSKMRRRAHTEEINKLGKQLTQFACPESRHACLS